MKTLAVQIHEVLAAHLERGGVLLGDNVHAGGIAGGPPLNGTSLPVGDRSALGLGIGMAMAGRSVVVELPALVHVIGSMLADLLRADGRPALVLRIPVGGAGPLDNGALPQGLQVWSPTAATAAGVLDHCLQGGVHLILEPRTAYAQRPSPVPFPGPVRTVQAGTGVTIASWGTTVAHDGAEILELLQLSPVPDAVAASVVRTGRLVVCHPDMPTHAAAVEQSVIAGAFLYLESPMARCIPADLDRTVQQSLAY